MTLGAILTMVITMLIVTVFAGYFFWKVLKTPNRPDE